MHSCHLTRRCSRPYWPGLEPPKQKATRNTGSAEHLAYASFLQLTASRSNLSSLVAKVRSLNEVPVRGGRYAVNPSHAHDGHVGDPEFTPRELRFSKSLSSSVRFSSFCTHALD